MNNLLNNNGANTNRGAVVIPRTTRANSTVTGINKTTGITMGLHSRLVSNALRNTLYSWAPVYKMITIMDINEDGSIAAHVMNTLGGNNPVARSFTVRNSEIKDMVVSQFDSYGRETIRKITVGKDEPQGTRYDYTEDLVLVKFKIKSYDEKSAKFAEAVANKVLSEGLTIKEDNTVVYGKEEGLHVNPLIWTPSNERSGQIIMTRLNPTEAWNKLEAIGGGTISRILEGEMNTAKFKKIASRLGLFATPAVEVANIGNDKFGMLVVNKDLTGANDFDAETIEKLKTVGIEIDTNQWDGAAYFSSAYAMDCLKAIGMNRADINKALMFAFQLRITGVYAKIFGEAVSQSVINRMAQNIMKSLKDVKVNGKEVFKVVGNPNNISMILDSNAAKLIDLDNLGEETVYLLDIAKGTKSGTATQMIDKYAIADKKATGEFLKAQATKESLEYVNAIGDNAQSLVGDDINVWQFLINLAKSVSADSRLSMDVFSDVHIFKKLLSDGVKKHEGAYRKGRVEIDSLFQRALFDATYLITGGVINSLLSIDKRGAVECYSTDVLEQYSEKIAEIENNDNLTEELKDDMLSKLLTANIIKYPTPGAEEIELVVFKTERQIRTKAMSYVNEGVIDLETARLLLNYFQFTAYGTIKIAADNALKHKLAGMDTDYDGVVVIFQKELVEIISNIYETKTAEIADATYGGTIPFIDCNKTAENYYTKAIVTDNKVNTSGIDIFNNIK